MSHATTLLDTIHKRLSTLQDARAQYASQIAPDFCVFNYMRRDELNLSSILKDLLDPNGSHSQGAVFLDKFIQICTPDIYDDWHKIIHNKSPLIINCEEPVGNTKRHMDILVHSDSHAICIENKPYANDGENQLYDYYHKGLGKFAHKHIIYLCETGEPDEISVPKIELDTWRINGEFTWLKYSDLIDWLSACKADCQSYSVTEFLNQFIKFIRLQFMGVKDMSEPNAILEEMKKNADTIAASFLISEHIDDLKRDFFLNLANDIRAKTEGKDYKLRPLIDSNKDKKLVFELKDTFLLIVFEFSSKRLNNPYVGIHFENKELSKKVDKYAIIANAVKTDIPKAKQSDNWCAWYFFKDDDLEFWSKESVASIRNGTMADEIIAEVDKLYGILSNNNLLAP